MKVRELAATAFTEIRAHKARSFMTCLSLSIGVAAMLFTFSQTGGMMKRYRSAMTLAGPGRIEVEKARNYVSKGLSPGITVEDAAEIRKQWPELYMVYPKDEGWGTRLRYGGFKSEDVKLVGITDEYFKRDWVYTQRGRLITARDVKEGARVCVVLQQGGWIKKPYWARFFPKSELDEYIKRHDPLGKQILLNDHVYTVVGVLQEPPKDRDPRWFRDWGGNGTVFVPISTFKLYQERPMTYVSEIQVDTGDAATAGDYIKKFEKLLKARHRGEEDFEIRDYRQIMDGALRQMKEFIVSIMIIGIVAIVASGIGIMNVTLATIFSRVREIGIRRALGATRADIVWQFVAEAMALGLVGGLGGTALGIVAIHQLAPKEDRMLEITAIHVGGALLIALGTGFLFALYPAYKASRFDPIEALRYE